jgi:two-component system nitrate/nitrite response regulator NarL
MAKIAVIDPGPISRAGMVSLLGTMGFAEVDDAPSLDVLRQTADGQAPDILLVNLGRAAGGVASLMQQVRDWTPHCSVVFLADALDLDRLADCFAAGASGYVSAASSREALEQSLRLVAAGGTVFPGELASHISELTDKLGSGASPPGAALEMALSERELDILRCLARGCSNKMIAAELNIAEATVKVHVKRILRKIRATNRTQAALWAAARGLTAAPKQDKAVATV